MAAMASASAGAARRISACACMLPLWRAGAGRAGPGFVPCQPPVQHLVFVFGTLKEGFPNFATNRGQRVPGRFTTRAKYPLYLVGERHTPWLMDHPGVGMRVAGQVFRVDDATLAAMDR